MELLERYNELTKGLLQSSLAATTEKQLLQIEAVTSALYRHIQKKGEEFEFTPQAIMAVVYSLTMSITEIMIEELSDEREITEEDIEEISEAIQKNDGEIL